MNRIDRILQAAALPDVPVEALPEDRQAGILNGTMQLVQQDAKKHGRKRVIRIMIAAALGLTPAAVRMRLGRSREAIRNELCWGGFVYESD